MFTPVLKRPFFLFISLRFRLRPGKIRTRDVRPTYVLLPKWILKRILKIFIKSRFQLWRGISGLNKTHQTRKHPQTIQVNISWKIKRDWMADFCHACKLNLYCLEKEKKNRKGLSSQYGKYKWLTCMSWSFCRLLWTVGAIAVLLTTSACRPGSANTDFAYFEKGHHERLPLQSTITTH